MPVEALDELAAVWWKYHRQLAPSASDMSDQEYEVMDAADSEVERLSQQVASLGALVAALVERAPDEEAIPYIGTWVLEDAEVYVGAQGIREVISSLEPAIADRVASGYLPNYGLRPQGGE